MHSLRSRVGSAIRRASGTFGTESDEEPRPPSPGGSSIKSNPSKRKRRISIFRPDGKRAPRQNTSDSPAGTVDGSAHAASVPAGDDSTTLPQPPAVSLTDPPVHETKGAHAVEPLEPQTHQASVEGASPVLTTEQQEAMQFLVPQSQLTGEEQTGSETAISPNQPYTELKTADIALSSSVDMNASAFEVIPSMSEPQPVQGENDGVEKSMER